MRESPRLEHPWLRQIHVAGKVPINKTAVPYYRCPKSDVSVDGPWCALTPDIIYSFGRLCLFLGRSLFSFFEGYLRGAQRCILVLIRIKSYE